MMRKMHLKTGDKAIILSGKDKGKIGEVTKVYPKTGKIIVEGVNIKTKHLKNEKKIVRESFPIDGSNAMFYSTSHKAPTRLGRDFLKDGTKVRVMKKFKENIKWEQDYLKNTEMKLFQL